MTDPHGQPAAPNSPTQPTAPLQHEPFLCDAKALLTRKRATPALRRYAAEMAAYLDGWQAGPLLTRAGFWHEPCAQGVVTPAEIAAIAGADVARLCARYCERLAAPPPPQWRGRADALKRVRLYAAAYAEPPLALLGAAHLWHAAVNHGAPATDNALALSLTLPRGEIQSVLLPLLEMLGLRDLRDDLLAFPGALPAEAAGLPSTEDQHRFFGHLNEVLAPLLGGALHSPLQTSALSMQVPHLLPRRSPFAFSERMQPGVERGNVQQRAFFAEVLVPTTADCYRLLQRLHSRPDLLRPVDNGVVDTVARCTPNGHRSLQTTLATPASTFNGRVTLQIVTPTMHQVNRWGAGAFFFMGQHVALLEALAEERAQTATTESAESAGRSDPYADCWWHARRADAARIDGAPVGSLPDTGYTANADQPPRQIIVFSPVGEPFAFDPGSTVVDYAYSVHSDLAEQCRRFYVNFEPVEPATVLRHMDLVALEHSPHAPGPTQAWLNAARTKRARTRIRRYLRRQTQGVNEGQQIMDGRLRALEEHYGFHAPDHRVDEVVARAARLFQLPSTEELLAEVAAGRVHADRILHTLFAEEIVRRLELPRAVRVRPDRVSLAQCCRPRPGDDVVALPHRRGAIITRVTVHKATCPQLLLPKGGALAEQHPLRWRLRAADKIAIHLDLSARDDDGLLGDALHLIYACAPRVTLFKTDAAARRGIARLRFSLEVDCQETVDELADRLRRLPGHEVSSVRQLALSPSEQDALHADATGAANPYSRMPVHDPTMFFGRTRELQEVSQAVDHNVPWFVLRGQKRVGKTSFLLHLRNHAWEPHVAVCAFVDLQAVPSLAQANVFYEVASAVYLDLEHDPRIASLGAPVRSTFAEHAPRRLADYLSAVRQRLGTRRLVVLIDEFSRTTDLLLAGELPSDFFQQWRSLLRDVGGAVSFVTVVQQKTYEQAQDTTRAELTSPFWHVLEMADSLSLKPLGPDDARRLIEWPIRNFVDYVPGGATRVLDLTGGSPFVIQAFCNKLVGHMTMLGTHTATLEDIDTVAELFMQPLESLFAHLLDLAPGRADRLITQMARLAEEGDAAAPLTWAQIAAAVPEIPPATKRRTLAALCANDILIESAPDQWRFTSSLFRRWLARNGDW
jgi:hypothetical protein